MRCICVMEMQLDIKLTFSHLSPQSLPCTRWMLLLFLDQGCVDRSQESHQTTAHTAVWKMGTETQRRKGKKQTQTVQTLEDNNQPEEQSGTTENGKDLMVCLWWGELILVSSLARVYKTTVFRYKFLNKYEFLRYLALFNPKSPLYQYFFHFLF